MNQPFLDFTFPVIYDGTTQTINIDLRKDPVNLSFNSNDEPTNFDIRKNLPTGVIGPYGPNYPASIVGSVVTFALPAQGAGKIFLTGTFTFD